MSAVSDIFIVFLHCVRTILNVTSGHAMVYISLRDLRKAVCSVTRSRQVCICCGNTAYCYLPRGKGRLYTRLTYLDA
jgi:hypothetical protein